MDFMLLAFIHYHLEIDHPFVCGDEAFFGISIFSYLIKSSGGFKLNET
jgi:hypothetical protein